MLLAVSGTAAVQAVRCQPTGNRRLTAHAHEEAARQHEGIEQHGPWAGPHTLRRTALAGKLSACTPGHNGISSEHYNDCLDIVRLCLALQVTDIRSLLRASLQGSCPTSPMQFC